MRAGEGSQGAEVEAGARVVVADVSYLDEHLRLRHDLNNLAHVRSGLLQVVDLLAKHPHCAVEGGRSVSEYKNASGMGNPNRAWDVRTGRETT